MKTNKQNFIIKGEELIALYDYTECYQHYMDYFYISPVACFSLA